MDVNAVAEAIVAALTLSPSPTDIGNKSILDAYQVIKDVLRRKFGPRSGVVKAFEELEMNPTSQARKGVVQEEIIKAKADRDPDFQRAAQTLLQQVDYSRRFWQPAPGNANVQRPYSYNMSAPRNSPQASRDSYQIEGSGSQHVIHGRPGLIVLLSIVLVAIFAFLIWQFIPALHVIPGSVAPEATPSPTPLNAQDTLTYFCGLVRSNLSDYAYSSLYSDNLKKQVKPQDFDQNWNPAQHPLTSCIGTIAKSSSKSASGTITVQSFPTQQNPNSQTQVYKVILIKDGQDGHWKIDSLQKQ